MTKAEFIQAVAREAGAEVPFVRKVLAAMTAVVHDCLAEGNEVQVGDLGKFKVLDKPAGTARNPATGETIQTAAKKVVKFRIGKAAKDAIR